MYFQELYAIDGVEFVEEHADPINHAYEVHFKNGYSLCIIRNRKGKSGFGGTYGANQGLWEILLRDSEVNTVTVKIGANEFDNVIGWLTVADIVEHSRKISEM